MDPLFVKMQLKDAARALVWNTPPELEAQWESLADVCPVDRAPAAKTQYEFVLVFVRECSDIRKTATKAVAAVVEDGLLWFAYPKKTSKRYSSDISRDDGWQPLGEHGFEPVRQIAIDDDWSALRFRETRFVKGNKGKPGPAASKTGNPRPSRG